MLYNNSWYRGKVRKIKDEPNSKKPYEIVYIDYGNRWDVSIKEMREIPEELSEDSQVGFAIHCGLQKVYPSNSTGEWDMTANVAMEKMLKE